VGVDGTRGALFALGVYVGVTETFAGVQSTANSYTSLWRSDTPATTLGAKRPRRSGLCLFGCFVPWRYLPLWTGSLLGLPLQPVFCKFLAAFRGFASSSNIRVFRRCRRREA
jgi:hypothetical protein